MVVGGGWFWINNNWAHWLKNVARVYIREAKGDVREDVQDERNNIKHKKKHKAKKVTTLRATKGTEEEEKEKEVSGLVFAYRQWIKEMNE